MKFGNYKLQRRKGASFMTVVMKTVRFVLMAYVGGLILINLTNAINITTTCNQTGGVSCMPFATAFQLLGITGSASGAVTLGTTGLISIIGILGAVYLIMTFVNVKKV